MILFFTPLKRNLVLFYAAAVAVMGSKERILLTSSGSSNSRKITQNEKNRKYEGLEHFISGGSGK